jgi:hypothetical protein
MLKILEVEAAVERAGRDGTGRWLVELAVLQASALKLHLGLGKRLGKGVHLLLRGAAPRFDSTYVSFLVSSTKGCEVK